MKCVCGQEGVHQHTVDGERFVLCGECHACLRVLSVSKSISLPMYIYLAVQAQDPFFYEFAREEARAPLTPESDPSPVVPVTASAPSPLADESFFVPLRENYHEVKRIPPEMMTCQATL